MERVILGHKVSRQTYEALKEFLRRDPGHCFGHVSLPKLLVLSPHMASYLSSNFSIVLWTFDGKDYIWVILLKFWINVLVIHTNGALMWNFNTYSVPWSSPASFYLLSPSPFPNSNNHYPTFRLMMDKENVVYISSGIGFSHKEEWNSVICSKIELEDIMLSEISQTQKDKCWLFPLICEN
jgi:hypothetical protein